MEQKVNLKKIIIVIDSLNYGGIQTSLISLLKFLSENTGHKIDLLVLTECRELIKFIPKKINIIRLNNDLTKYLQPIRKNIKKELKSKNLKYIFNILKYSKKFGKLKLGESIRYNVVMDLDNLLGEYDLAIAYTDSSSLYYVSEKINSNRKIVWVHMDYNKKSNRPVQHEYFYKKMDKIICVSNKAKNSFDTLNHNLSNKTVVITNLLDIDKINKMKNEKIIEFSKNYFNIVSVGRLSKEKNFSNLIKVFSEVRKIVNKELRLYIIGEGIEREKLEKLIKKLDLENFCFLLGKKENPYKYMNACDLYVQASLKEGFGMTLYEAKYLRKPILTTRVSGTDELFINEKNAIIVKNDNEIIKHNFIRIINDTELRKKLVDNLLKEKIIEKNQNILKIIEE